MELGSVHHIAIIGSDRDRSKHFYVDLLGFKVLSEIYREDRREWKLDLTNGECDIELFIDEDRPKRPTYPEAYGLRHLAFRVSSVRETAKALNALGIKTEPIRKDSATDTDMTFFFDPDGLPLELREG